MPPDRNQVLQEAGNAYFANELVKTRLLAALLFSHTVALAQMPSNLTGDWRGTLGKLTLTAHLQDAPGGLRTATLDIPAQYTQGLPLGFLVQADSVYLDLPAVRARFAGRWTANGPRLVGEWQQDGQILPLTFSLVAVNNSGGDLKRPQTPHPPFPYQSQDVTFRNEVAGVTLRWSS